MADDAPLPAEAAELVEQLITRVHELEDDQKLLNEVVDAAEQLITRVNVLEFELFELAASPAALSCEVLLLPGVKRLLLRSFHPDNKPGLSKAERTALAEAWQKITAAYDGLEKKGGQSWLTMH